MTIPLCTTAILTLFFLPFLTATEHAQLVDFDRNPLAIERLLTFGRDLQTLYSRVTSSRPNEQLKTMLQVHVLLRGGQRV